MEIKRTKTYRRNAEKAGDRPICGRCGKELKNPETTTWVEIENEGAWPIGPECSKIVKRGREMAARRWVVKRMYGGFWQFYAGQNDALGAPRWSSADEAQTFRTRAEAERLAKLYDAFVVRQEVK
jgi:hypothetical protein